MSSSSSFSSDLQNANPKLLRRIQRACRPTLSHPDLALNMEICDLINEKQGALPRHAAVVTVKLVNSRDPQVSELAIQLLDVLAKNCGYPFHLQISRKEFLNELVKRFPERPPPRYSRSQRLILGLIEEWTQTLCKTSRYKSDLGFIRDMRRLLAYKGYVFPELKREDAAVLNPSDNLKSIEEIQKEEKVAQSAKLQELIRRGRPQDLKEANKLMKIMSGFKDEELLEQTKQKVAEDVNKLKRKVDIFQEMVNNASNTGKIDTNDSTINDLYYALKVSQPKIQKIIEEESDDTESVTNLLQLNDTINTVISQYTILKGGEPLPTSSSTGGMNLIDFDDDDTNDLPLLSLNNSTPQQLNNDLVDLLSDLNFNSDGSASQQQSQQLFGMGGSIMLESSPPPTGMGGSSLTDLGNLNQTLNSNSTSSSNNNNQFGGLLNKYDSPIQSPQLQQQQPQQQLPSNQGLDPFQFNFDNMSSTSSQQQQQQQQQQQLSSSSNGNTASTTNKILVNQSQFLKFEIEKISQSDSKIALKSLYSNLSPSAISSLQIMLAASKSWDLQLLPQSGNFINGMVSNGVSQFVNLTKKSSTDKPVKIKWKLNYIVNGNNVEESGVLTL